MVEGGKTPYCPASEAMLMAVKHGNLQLAQDLVNHCGARENYRNKDGTNLLSAVAQSGIIRLFHIYADEYPEMLYVKDSKGYYPISYLIESPKGWASATIMAKKYPRLLKQRWGHRDQNFIAMELAGQGHIDNLIDIARQNPAVLEERERESSGYTPALFYAWFHAHKNPVGLSKLIQTFPSVLDQTMRGGPFSIIHTLAIRGIDSVFLEVIQKQPQLLFLQEHTGTTPPLVLLTDQNWDMLERAAEIEPDILTFRNNEGHTLLSYALRQQMFHSAGKIIKLMRNDGLSWRQIIACTRRGTPTGLDKLTE